MAVEIERKFLVKNQDWKKGKTGRYICQAYLCHHPERTVRVRICENQAWLTIKGKGTGIVRPEFEYEIPLDDARKILALCNSRYIEKIRYTFQEQNVCWEVDEFLERNSGLVLAEVELEDEKQKIILPSWIGEEVSTDPRYTNACLSKHPYALWPSENQDAG